MPFGFLNSFWHFDIETWLMCCCNVELSFQKFVQNKIPFQKKKMHKSPF